MQGNNGESDNFWYLFITVAGISGIINIVKAFKRPTWAEFEKKDREIDILRKKVKHYQKMINDSDNK